MSHRPAAVVAWILLVALLVACPQIVTVAVAVAAWALETPAVLAAGAVAAVAWCRARPVAGVGRRWA